MADELSLRDSTFFIAYLLMSRLGHLSSKGSLPRQHEK